MSQTLINELSEENLCTYFVLPLLKLNKFSFTSSNFMNCYLTKSDSKRLVVQVVDINLVSRKAFAEACIFRKNGKGDYFFVYLTGLLWQKDLELFCEGKFSAMSIKAKDMIRRFSGLVHKGPKGRTDGRLLALDKHPVLKNMWERELTNITGSQRSIVDLPEEMELLSIPGEKSYISLEGMVRI